MKISTTLIALCAVLADASNPKRGMISDLDSSTYSADVEKFISPKVTKLSWYYSFGHYPDAKFSSRYQFVMQQFGIDTTSDNGNKSVHSQSYSANISLLIRNLQFQEP